MDVINPVARAYTVRMNNGECGPRDIGNHIDRGEKSAGEAKIHGQNLMVEGDMSSFRCKYLNRLRLRRYPRLVTLFG